MRLRFKGVLDAIGGALNKAGIHPNAMTITGVLGNAVAAMLLARGEIVIGGLWYWQWGPLMP